PEAYAERLRSFLARYAPRRPLAAVGQVVVDDEADGFVAEVPPEARSTANLLSKVPVPTRSQAAAV
ncbi:MAG: hypothetical protein U0790_24055, partial [Isosphaeraceae bacterium]